MTSITTRFTIISTLLSTSTALSMSPIQKNYQRTSSSTLLLHSSSGGYDLGIGKHQPLHTDFGNDQSIQEDDIYHAAQFMVEYESTNHFPSPFDNENSNVEQVVVQSSSPSSLSSSTTTVQQPTTKPKKFLPKVQPKRQLEDVLWIVVQDNDDASTTTNKNNNNRHQTIHSVGDRHELDVNSIWVEMLIHHNQQEQQQAAIAAANQQMTYVY